MNHQWVKEDNILRSQMSLALLILNGTALTKLAILAFLYFGDFVKNSVVRFHEYLTDLLLILCVGITPHYYYERQQKGDGQNYLHTD